MILPLFVIIPLFAAILTSLCRKLSNKLLDSIVLLSTLGLAFLSLKSINEVSVNKMVVYKVGNWVPKLSIHLVMDGLTVLMLVTVNVLLLILVVYSIQHMEKVIGKWKYYSLLMILISGVNGVLISADLFNAFVFLEVTLIAVYILASFYNEGENFEASFKYMVLGSISSMFILLAIALVYAKTSSLSFVDIIANLNTNKGAYNIFIVLLFVIGLSLKATLVPFHSWVPDAYTSAPSPISAVYSGVICKVLGLYLLMRMFYNILGINYALLNLLSILGVVSIIVAVILALYQWDFKRLLAYHSVSQIGYIALGIGLGTPLGILGGIFHLINHSTFKPLLFLNAGSIEYAANTRNIKDLGGLSEKMPVTSGSSMIASMSISGVPPLSGFWSKIIIIVACIQANHYWFAFLAVLGSILTLASFLKVQRYIFYGYIKDNLKNISEVPFFMKIAMITLALLCMFMGLLLLPKIYDNFLGLAVNALLRGKDYAVFVGDLLR
ncbi:complex I subunit 5 family protein [Elusimicrobiota bacterium]